jgi:outer membrane protein TolC
VDPEEAFQRGHTLNPHFRRQEIWKRKAQISREDERGNNAPSVRLEATYGLENSDPQFREIWHVYDNSNSVKLNAYIPIIDWGERKKRVAARQIDIERTQLEIEENRLELRKTISTTVNDLNAYQERLTGLEKSMEVARTITAASIKSNSDGLLSMQDLLSVLNRHRDTQIKLRDAYLGYRRALLSLMVATFYDYENRTPLTKLTDADLPERFHHGQAITAN